MTDPAPRTPHPGPRHRRGVTRAALVGALAVLTFATVAQILGAARFAEDALTGSAAGWGFAGVALLGGGLSAALTIVAGQALAADLRTRPLRSRQDVSRGQLSTPASPDSPSDTRPGGAVPSQRLGGAGATREVAGGARPRSRGGVHRAGPR